MSCFQQFFESINPKTDFKSNDELEEYLFKCSKKIEPKEPAERPPDVVRHRYSSSLQEMLFSLLVILPTFWSHRGLNHQSPIAQPRLLAVPTVRRRQQPPVHLATILLIRKFFIVMFSSASWHPGCGCVDLQKKRDPDSTPEHVIDVVLPVPADWPGWSVVAACVKWSRRSVFIC